MHASERYFRKKPPINRLNNIEFISGSMKFYNELEICNQNRFITAAAAF
jgi:hypothetical protein